MGFDVANFLRPSLPESIFIMLLHLCGILVGYKILASKFFCFFFLTFVLKNGHSTGFYNQNCC